MLCQCVHGLSSVLCVCLVVSPLRVCELLLASACRGDVLHSRIPRCTHTAHTLPESVAVSYAESAVFPLVCVTDEGSTAGADDSADTHTASVSASATLCSTWCLPLSYSTHHTLSPNAQTSMAPLSLLHIHTAQHLQSLSLFFFYFILFFAHSGVSVLCVSLPVQCGRDDSSALL